MPHFQKLVSASGDAIQVVGVYNLKYVVGNREIFQPTLVCRDHRRQSILGCNAIKKLAISWIGSRDAFVDDKIVDSVSKKNNISFQENLDPSNYTTEIATVAKLVIPPL